MKSSNTLRACYLNTQANTIGFNKRSKLLQFTEDEELSTQPNRRDSNFSALQTALFAVDNYKMTLIWYLHLKISLKA